MSVKLVKYCPLCGVANDPGEPFCTACRDGELMSLRPEPLRTGDNLAHETPAAVADAARGIDWEAEAAPATPAMAAVAVEAEAMPRRDTMHVEGDMEPATLVLELVEQPELRFTIADGQSVGASRDASRRADVTLSGVSNLDYISSVHARFFRRGKQWYVQHSGATNFIKVDGTKYEKREEVPVHHGAVIVLSKTPFRVVLGGEG